MSTSCRNKLELKTAEVILFHRQHATKPVYHMRIHIKGMG